MRSLLSVVVLLASSVAASHAAPAPLPRRAVLHAEVELDLGTAKERARLAGTYLRSPLLLEDASRDGGVASYLPDLSESRRREWLAERLSVTVEGDRARLRLRGDAEALAVLHSLVDRLIAPPETEGDGGRRMFLQALAIREELVRRVELIRRLRERSPDRISREDVEMMEAQAGRYEIQLAPLAPLSRPRQVVVRR